MSGMALPATDPTTPRLVEEAMKKASVAWVSVDGHPGRPVWCLPADGALWVVSGPGEQQLPGLSSARTVLVTLRGDHGGRIVTWRAAVTRLSPDTPQWQQIAPQLAAKRLNAPDDPAALVQRWAHDRTVYGLTPLRVTEAGPTLPTDAQTEPLRDTPARPYPRDPFRSRQGPRGSTVLRPAAP
jgi:hypothetical protein